MNITIIYTVSHPLQYTRCNRKPKKNNKTIDIVTISRIFRFHCFPWNMCNVFISFNRIFHFINEFFLSHFCCLLPMNFSFQHIDFSRNSYIFPLITIYSHFQHRENIVTVFVVFFLSHSQTFVESYIHNSLFVMKKQQQNKIKRKKKTERKLHPLNHANVRLFILFARTNTQSPLLNAFSKDVLVQMFCISSTCYPTPVSFSICFNKHTFYN